MHHLEQRAVRLAISEQISVEILLEKYAKGAEICAADVFARVAYGLCA